MSLYLSKHSKVVLVFMVMVFTPAGEAEFTFENVVACLRCCTYDPCGSRPNFKGPTRTSL